MSAWQAIEVQSEATIGGGTSSKPVMDLPSRVRQIAQGKGLGYIAHLLADSLS